MSEELKDHLGTVIRVGDTVVWGVSRGAYGMRSGIVTEIDPTASFQTNVRVKGSEFRPGGWMAAEGMAVIIPSWQITEFNKWMDERIMLEDAMERHG
jgi:hypothetical protein